MDFSNLSLCFFNSLNLISVIARNPKSLSDTAQGRSGFGTKTILDQAAEFVQAAEDNQCFFRPPKVCVQSPYGVFTFVLLWKAE